MYSAILYFLLWVEVFEISSGKERFSGLREYVEVEGEECLEMNNFKYRIHFSSRKMRTLKT